MNKPLRILHLEDDPDYHDLVKSLLYGDNILADLTLVSTRSDFEAKLDESEYDVILADYLLPCYNGVEALRVANARCPETPFLLVSGTIGEQAALESLKSGATDYVLKLCPDRLVPAIRRAAQEMEVRRQRRQAETEYRLIFEGNPTPMWVWDQESLKFHEVNDAALQHYGYTREEFLKMTLRDIRPAEEVPPMVEYVHRLTAKGETPAFGLAGIWRHRKKDGSLIDVEIKWSPISFQGRPASLTMANDVTERKRTERRDAALSKLGQRLSSATSPLEAAQIIRSVTEDLFPSDAFSLDLFSEETGLMFPMLNTDTDRSGVRFEVIPTGRGITRSPRARRIMEQGAELLLRDEPLEPPTDAVPFGDVTRPSASLMLAPVRNRTKAIGVLSLQSYTHRAYSAADLEMLQSLADHCAGALDRISAERASQEHQSLFAAVWENSVDGMRLTDESGKIVAVNGAFCKLLGLTRDELVGQLFTVMFAATENAAKHQTEHQARFRSRSVESLAGRKLTLRNGSHVTLEETHSFVELSGKAPLLLVLFRDITAQRQLEDQLRQSQKMEAIGQLAGGVAHDFNNILTVISGHASLLQATGTLTGNAARSAGQISQSADRAAGLTRQLLTFSRRQVMQPRRLDLNEVVNQLTKMLARILGEDISLQVTYAPAPLLVQADTGMLEQVLLNLAVNSRDAMPKGGQLVIELTRMEVDARRVADHPEAHTGRFVCLSVEDSGCGIPPENLRRIFEPFFTTKELGKGTGLGLATVYGIVKQHQGWIEVESQLDQGTTFRVFLPENNGQPQEADAPPAPRAVRGGPETILVVEDEEAVRELVCNILAGHGYQVLQADSGVRALEVWSKHSRRIQLLLTDLVMPNRLNGRELAEKLCAERPDLKVIYTSGYSADVVGKDFVLRSDLNYLQKPYSPQKLALTVRDCLDAVKG